MSWDKWLKKYGELLSDAWKVAFDVLQEKGEEPPVMTFLVRRKPPNFEAHPEFKFLPEHYKLRYLEEGRLLYRGPSGWWTTIEKAKRYNSRGAASSASNYARDSNKYFDELISDIEIVYCCMNPIHIEPSWQAKRRHKKKGKQL